MGRLLLLIVLGICIYLLIVWYKQCSNNPLLHIPDQADVINVGSTYAYYDFDYSGLHLKGANLANIPQYLDYDMILLKKYIHKVKKNGKVLIVLPGFVFASSVTNDDKKIYYEALYPWEIKGFRLSFLLKYIWKASKEPFIHAYKKEKLKWAGHVASPAEKIAHAKRRVSDWETNLKIPNVQTNEISEELKLRIKENQERLLHMICLCRQHETEPILIIPPVSYIMQKEVSKDCLERYLRTPIYEIIEKTKVRLLDYQNDREFSNIELYLNSDCLNEKGRRLFMIRLIGEL